MARYMLFVRGGYDAYVDATPEQIEEAIGRYVQWSDKLRREGRLVLAEKIKDGDRRIMRQRAGDYVVDGPLPEDEETIGGFFIINAAGHDEAFAIARGCPIFGEGGSLEIRELEQG
jgi:hypothetical protein